ncbi:MAG: CarD family transcriptional regulator [Oscillospiraceae bacterium]|nr:CarD family transcriptional regulator [Oscillospiraceae bacterium]MBR2503685.1 CarD family transcriptional regulator [Oscillospiraceae bacterium]
MANKFAVNDYVIYGKSGLCFVKEIKKMRMANGPLSEYYILNSATGNAVTIYVPCDKENLVAKMRPPMTKEEIDNILLSAKGQQIPWIDNNNERSDRFREITDGENYGDWLLLASCLHLKKKEKQAANKHLSTRDENTLKLLEKLIEDEFCYSLNLERSQVAEYIRDKLGINQ